jgi:hypothetical protein
MNRQRKEDLNRPWLKEELFVITKDLNDFLRSNHTLTEKEKRQLSIIQHTILRNDDSSKGHYVHISSERWVQLIGKDYRKWINYLADLGGLIVNERYSNQSNQDRKAFTKSYRVPGFSRHDPEANLSLGNFQRLRIPTYTDKSDLSDDLSKHVFKSLKELTIKESLNDIDLPVRRAFALEDCKKMYRGCFNVNYGTNSNRLGHVVIRMVREARSNLRFKYSEDKLISCDITSCFPNLITFWISDTEEKSEYLKVLKGDFHQNLIREIGTKKSRNQIKKDVVTYLCDSTHQSVPRLNEWFKKHLPHFSEWKRKQDQMALMLQNKEAEIINLLGQYCVENRIWFVPMYDGFLCGATEQTKLVKECESIFRTLIGHNPRITISNLG